MAADALQYLKLDFQSHKEALIQRIRARYPGVWNDFQQSNFGTIFINVVAWSTALLAWSVNKLVGENFISTMTLRESAVRLGSLVGYRLRNPVPATVTCDATLSAPASALVTLARGTPVRTGDSLALVFELATDYTVEVGQLTPRRVAVTFDPNAGGARNVPALVKTVLGVYYVDCLDATVDLRQFAEPGQVLSVAGQEYVIASVEIAPGALSYNRLGLETAVMGTAGSYVATVYDRRITFVQGQTRTEKFTATGVLGFAYPLASTPVIDNSVEVSVNGRAWAEVNSLAGQPDLAEVYVVRYLPAGSAVVVFGDNKLGAALPAGAAITVTYRTGGGVVGNIASGLLNTTVVGLITSLQNPVTVKVVNRQPGQGGQDAETLEEARVKIPAYTRTNDRAVTLGDYETLAKSFTGTGGQVSFARAAVKYDNALLEGNVVHVYAWAEGASGGLVPVAGGLKLSLQQFLQAKAVGTDFVVMADGVVAAFPLASRVKVAEGYDPDDVSVEVVEVADKYVENLVPGEAALYSRLIGSLATVPGVDHVDLAVPNTDLAPETQDTVFSAPAATYAYTPELTSGPGGLLTGQLAFAPRFAWTFRARLTGLDLAVSPDVTPGYARLTGPGLKTSKISRVNLGSGLVELYVDGVPGDLDIFLKPVQAYVHERPVDLYVSYDGDQSAAKRREVRVAARGWAQGLAVGATLYAEKPLAAAPPTSLREVVAAVPGVGVITGLSLDAPSNVNTRVDVGEHDLVVVRRVFLNGRED